MIADLQSISDQNEGHFQYKKKLRDMSVVYLGLSFEGGGGW